MPPRRAASVSLWPGRKEVSLAARCPPTPIPPIHLHSICPVLQPQEAKCLASPLPILSSRVLPDACAFPIDLTETSFSYIIHEDQSVLAQPPSATSGRRTVGLHQQWDDRISPVLCDIGPCATTGHPLILHARKDCTALLHPPTYPPSFKQRHCPPVASKHLTPHPPAA